MKPTVREQIGGYFFTWEEENLAIVVSKVRVHSGSDARVIGEILLKSIKTDEIIYPPTTFNFISSQSRSRLVKTLKEEAIDYHWDDIFKQLCVAVIERAREGEPVRELWTSDDIPPPQFLLEPLLYKGLPTILFGEKAVCKSALSLVIYICLTLPWHDNPLGWKAPDHPVKTLLLDYEVDYDVAHYNMKQLQQGMGLPPFPLYYRRCSLPLVDDITQIQQHMANMGATALIVDSLGPAVGGDLKDPGQALRFTTALRQLRCASLLIGQTSKDKESKHKSTFGSIFFEYYARNIFLLDKIQEEGEDSLDLAMYNTYHNLGRKFKSQGFRLNFNGTGTHIESCPITARELVKRIGAQAQIIDLLKKEGYMTTQEIMEELEISRGNADMTLKRLRDKGKIIKPEDKWGLVLK